MVRYGDAARGAPPAHGDHAATTRRPRGGHVAATRLSCTSVERRLHVGCKAAASWLRGGNCVWRAGSSTCSPSSRAGWKISRYGDYRLGGCTCSPTSRDTVAKKCVSRGYIAQAKIVSCQNMAAKRWSRGGHDQAAQMFFRRVTASIRRPRMQPPCNRHAAFLPEHQPHLVSHVVKVVRLVAPAAPHAKHVHVGGDRLPQQPL